MRYSFFTATRMVTARNPMIAIRNAHALDLSCSNQLIIPNQNAHEFGPDSIGAPFRAQWRLHRAELSSFSDRYLCQSSDKSCHTYSSKSIRMSLCCHSLAQTDVNTETPCNAFISSRENRSATRFIMPSICALSTKL